MSLRRRHLLATALLPLLASRPASAAATELKFWSWRQEDRAFYQSAIASFQQANPDISIAFSAFDPTQYPTILSTALAGGSGPDLMQVRSAGGLANLAAPGYLMKLDTALVPELANFADTALRAESLDGSVYAVPFASQTMLVIANTELLAQAGVGVPASWDDLLAACKTLKEKGITPFANGTATSWQNETLTFSLLSSQLGRGFVADIESGKTDFNDPRFVGALGRLAGLRDYLAPNFTGVDYASAQQLFTAGRAAMFAGGSFELANFRHQNPKLKLDVFAAPGLQASDAKLVGLYFDGGYAVNAKTDKAAAAVKFLRYLASPGYATAFANTLQNISPVAGVKMEDALLGHVAKLNESAIPYLMLADFRYHDPSGSTLLQNYVQKMMAGAATPAEAGAEITKGIATYYKPFQK